jgi:hypothetical protein
MRSPMGEGALRGFLPSTLMVAERPGLLRGVGTLGGDVTALLGGGGQNVADGELPTAPICG